MLYPTLAAAQSVPSGVTQIIPDGRTATTVTTNGSVTGVTTTTIAGPNAFNSFSQFKVGNGNTANLYVPGGSQNLINVVRDGAVVVNGIVNSYKNGQIGGNVYFADPHGFVVGKSGVINTGSLTVTTPTREFVDSLISPQGQISAGATQQLLNGNVPLSADGAIAIRGRINANDGVRLIGQTVSVGPGHEGRNGQIAQAAKFAATVNSKGLRNSSGIVVRNGSIQIVAGGDARINGKLAARSQGSANAISVTAGKDITVGSKARVSTNSKTANGGDVVFKADGDLAVKPGARFDSSSKTGDAGNIELSAKNRVTLASAIYNLSAPNGKEGTLLVDPTDITIAAGNSMTTNGGNVNLVADNSITIAADGVIDTRNFNHAAGLLSTSNATLGNSGTIRLTAPIIAVNGQLLAEVSTGSAFSAGNIFLTATSSQTLISGPASATSTISIAGTMRGANITLTTDATAISSYTNSTEAFLALGAQTALSALLGINGGYVAGSSTSTIKITGTANLSATQNVTLRATGKQEASDPAITLTGNSPVASAAVIGTVDANVSATIDPGAHISAANLSLFASNEATLAVSAISVTTGSSFLNNAVAYGAANINTSATISSGANLQVSNAVQVLAHNTNSFSSSASSISLGAGKAGLAIAISDVTSNASARLGASLSGVSSIQIEATSNNIKNSTSSSVTVGNPALVGVVVGLFATTSLGNFIADKLASSPLSSANSPAIPKFGSAIAIANSNISAKAAIAGDTPANAPTIVANGSVSVISDINDQGMRSLADASINSEASNPTSANPAATVAIAAAIAVGKFNHNSNAYIGANTSIQALNIGIKATTTIPITNTWTDWNGLTEVLSHLNGNLGVVNNILTSYANAVSDSDKLSLAGAVNYLSLSNTTTAWVGSGASLDSTGVAPGSAWSVTRFDGQATAFDPGVSVKANTDTQTVNVAGNSSPLTLGGSGGAGSAVGGSLELFKSSTSTIAGIADGATVSSKTKIIVDAATHDVMFSVAPSSGRTSGQLALTGITAIAYLTNTTHASISNTALVSAPEVDISATQGLSLISVAAAIALSKANTVGIAVAVLVANMDTAAYIGANRADIVGTNPTDDPFASAATGGHVHATNLNVAATTSGRLFAISAAAAVTDPTATPPKSLFGKLEAYAIGEMTEAWEDAFGKASQAASAAGAASPSGFSLDIAGSSSATSIKMNTTASITGATIDQFDSTHSNSTSAVALNNTIMANASGAGALNMSGSSSSGATAISGAIAVALSDNATKAFISGTTISNAKDVTVQALGGGQQTVVGIGLAVTTGGGSSNAASLSASVAVITDSVSASIAKSTITGMSTATNRAVAVDAYQTTDIGIGAGSLYLGGTGGLGIGLTYAEVSNPTGGNAADARISSTGISAMDSIDVLAIDSSRIGSGAAAGGGGPDSNGLAGAIVVNVVKPTISASINADDSAPGTSPTISVTGDITVRSDGTKVSAFDTALANVVSQTNAGNAASNDSGIDFSAADLNGGTGNTPGAAVIGVAGMVQAGKNNIGLSLVVNTIAASHLATVSRALITSSGGDVTIIANDNTKILGVAVGLGVSTGLFAGLASTVVNTITTTTLARVGNDQSTTTLASITARNVTVQANDTESVRGAAGTLGIGTGNAAAGLSLVYDSIGGSVTADVNGAKLVASGDISVKSASSASILTVAMGIAMASNIGIAGSVATSILKRDVTAQIRGSSDVMADNNVAVLASNTNTIQVIAGAAGIGLDAAGVGISVVVNEVGGTTAALISGASTYVDAKGLGANFQSVNNGVLNHTFDVSTADNPSSALPDLSEQQKSLKGLAVVATSHQAIVGDAVTLGLSIEPFTGDALALVPVTSLMRGTTTASIDSAHIDTRLTVANAAGVPEIYVGASSQTYTRNLVIAAGLSLGLSGAGAASGTQLSRTTTAYMNNAIVGTLVGGAQAAGNITINAASTQISSNVAVGFAFGFGGGAASAIVNVFSADTEAYATGGSINGRSLTINAKSTDGFFAAAGAGAAGLIGIAGAFAIGVSNNTTRAYLGNDSGTMTVALSNGLTVSAVSDNTFNSYAIGGALGGQQAIAGMAVFTVVNNTTEAKVDRATVTQTADGTSVTATETITLNPTTGAGALALQGGAVGAGVNVVLLKSQVAATILNSTITAPGTVNVAASSTKDITAMTATVGAGSSFGIGAATSVILVGSTAPSDATSQISGTVNTADAMSSGAAPGNGVRSTSTPGNNQPAAAAPPRYSIASALGSASDAVTAEITGGTTNAGAVTVVATSKVSTTNTATGVGVGGASVGLGGAVAYTRVFDTVTASVSGAVNAASLAVQAQMLDDSGHAADVRAFAGAGGFLLGVGAAVADGSVQNTVTANIGGTITGTNAGNASADAEDKSSVAANAVGATLGGVAAVGASVAIASKTSGVSSSVEASSTVANYNRLDVTAVEDGTVAATAIAGAGGVGFAGVGAGATATDNATIDARIGHNSTLTLGNGGLNVIATATPKASSSALGIAVSQNVGIGASVALTTVGPHVTAAVEDSTAVNNASGATANVTVSANAKRPTSGKSATSSAIAGTGGSLVGVNATVSTANNNAQASATVGNSVTLPSGAIVISALNQTSQSATTTGVSAGTYAVGFNLSNAGSNTVTTASLGNLASINAASLSVTATGDDINNAEAVAGTGGVVAGNASYAATSSHSNTTASVGSSDATHRIVLSGAMTVQAQHTTTFSGSSNSINASLVGGSGALLFHSIDSTVSASIADNTYIRSRDLSLRALNTTTHLFSNEGNPDDASWDLNSGSGGLLNLPAGKMQIDLSHNTTASIGNNADIHLLAPSSGLNTFKVEAYNDIKIHEKAKLDSGGLIAIADTQAFFNINRNDATISIGNAANTASTIIQDTGDTQIGAWHNVDLDLRVASTTYGYAGAPSGKAEIVYTGADTVNIGKNTRLEAANGALTLAAGDSPDGLTVSVIKANATLDLYNKTAIPIPIPPDPKVRVNATADIFIDTSGNATNAGIRSAGDMALYADRGTITMSAVGTGKDIYREALAAAASAVSNLFGGGNITFDYHGGSTGQTGLATLRVDGVAITGIQRTKFLTLSYDSNYNLLVDTNGISYTLDPNASAGGTLLFRLSELQSLLVAYAADPIARGAYASEILFLKQKLIAMGLATGDPSGSDAAHPFIIGAWAQGIQAAYAQVARDKQIINGASSAVSSRAGLVIATNAFFDTNGGTAINLANDASGQWVNSTSLADSLLSTIAGFHNTAAAGYAAALAAVIDQQAAGLALKQAIDGYQQALTTARTNLTLYKNTISGLQADIAAKSTIATTPGTAQATVDAAYVAMAADVAALKTATDNYNVALSAIFNNTASLRTASGQLATAIADLKTKVNTLATTAKTSADDTAYNGTVTTGLNTLNGYSGNATTDSGSANASVQSMLLTFANITTTLVPLVTTSTFEFNASYATYPADSAALANATTGLSGTGIVVGDVTAKLGNLNLKADRVIGSGDLRSPGDAQINIVNNTANILEINNLTINSDSGGRMRYNGVLVDSLADINALNLKGGTAAFSNVVTAKTQAAAGIFASISIASNFDPTINLGPITASSPGGNYPAPDIILNSGSKISNPLGSVTVESKAGNIYSNGAIEANTVTIHVKNGDFVQSYVFGYDHVAGDPAGTGLNGGDPTQNATGGGIIANGAVFISARYLNINGLIQSGIDQWTLTLANNPTLAGSASLFGVDLTAAIGAYNNQVGAHTRVAISTSLGTVYYNGTPGQIEFDIAFANADRASGHSQVANGLYKLVPAGGSNIDAFYDAANNQFQADATKVLGGYIQLYGQIMNTSPGGAADVGGRIRVLDGFGQITINNPTTRSLVLNTLDTGLDPSGVGRGVAGVIDITNVSVDQATNAVSAVHTVYTRNSALDLINIATTTGTLSATGTVVGTTVNTSAGGRSTSYALPSGLRYVYTTGTDSSTVTYLEYVGVQLFGSSSLTIDSSVTPTGSDGPHILGQYRIATGTYTTTDLTNNGAARVDTTNTYTTNTVYVKTAEWTSCNWWTLCGVSSHHTEVTKTDYNTTVNTVSLKANYPIAIQFGGSDSGSITVNSSAPVILKGVINNKNGTTAISGTSITVDPNLATPASTLISSKGISLTATNGSVGVLNGTAIQIDLTNGGALTASATNGNINVAALHDLRINTVVASGDTTLTQSRIALSAGGNILRNDANSYIQGARIELSAANGSIGAANAPIVVHVGNADTTGGFTPAGYYGFKANASTDINVVATAWSGNTAGDLLLDTVASLGGNVTLTAPGRIIDNNPIQSIDTRTYNQLLHYWDTLGLVANTAGNQAKQDAAKATFESGKVADYQQYWQFRRMQADGGAVYDPNFSYVASAAERTLLTQQFSSLDPTLTPAQLAAKIADYEASRTAQYRALNTEVGSYTATFDANFSIATASQAVKTAIQAAEVTLLNGASWTERELAFSLSPGALKTITGTNPIIKSANVSGREVTLNAGMGLGQTLDTIVIDTSTINSPLDLTDAQKIALVTAERSDFVANSNPNLIVIAPKQPLNFAATTGLNVNVNATPVPAQPDVGAVYLASTGDALLRNIDVSGEARFKVRGSIVNATPTSADIVTGNLILEASNGAIGRIQNLTTGNFDDMPLRVALRSGATIIARAADGINIIATNGDLNTDTVYSPNDVRLQAAGSILNANGDQLINILGSNVTLVALSGTIGAVGNALNVGTNLNGGIVADALGLINLYGAAGREFTIRHLSTADRILVTASGNGTIDGTVISANQIEFDSTALLTFTANALVTSTASSIAINTSLGTPIAVTAVVDMQAGSQFIAANGITIITGGNATVSSLRSTTGDILVKSGADATVTTVSVTDLVLGKITFQTVGALNVTSASAAGLIDVMAGGLFTLASGGQLTSRTNKVTVDAGALAMGAGSQFSAATGIDVHTSGNLAAESLATGAGDITVRSDADASVKTAAIADAASGAITFGTTGALTVGSASSAGRVKATVGSAFTLAAGGQLVSRTNQVNVDAGSMAMGAGSQASGSTGIDIRTTGGFIGETLLSATGGITVNSGADATIKTVSIADAALGTISLRTAGALNVTSASVAGPLGVTAGGLFTLAPNGQLISRTNKITVDAGSMTMGAGSQASGSTGVDIRTSGGFVGETLLSASGDITLRSGADASVKTASIADAALGAISFDTTGSLTVGSASSAGKVMANVGGALVLADGGQIVSRTDQVTIAAGSLMMGQGANVTAADRIGIATAGNAVLGRLVSTLNPGANTSPVISVAAGTSSVAGAILGNGDGQINIKTVRPNAAIMLTATNGIGTALVPITIDVPILTALATGGDINIEAIGDLKVPLLSAPLGETNLNATGNLALDNVRGANVKFNSQGDVNIGTITVVNSLKIAANTIEAGVVQPAGSPSPLVINFTGPNGGIAQSIVVNIDAPNGTNFSQLFATDASVTTNGVKVGILNGFVPGKLTLVTPSQDIVLDNRSPVPTVGPSVQLYGPGRPFTLIQNNNAIFTTDFAVAYGVNSAVTALSVFEGMSFVRDFPRTMENGEPLSISEVKKDGKTFYVIGLSPSAMLDAFAIPKSVESVGSGPAVNLDGLQ